MHIVNGTERGEAELRIINFKTSLPCLHLSICLQTWAGGYLLVVFKIESVCIQDFVDKANEQWK